ncbi:Six-bladed beta-propeller, TolB-like protein [Cordyceps fumosorosea ARSEF 2679]|uniref:Six-bladed beta-propeller, TolB-like protein n=1 Tax=Cordyceps fumosorosea (strain ARSEF 2679) TaxID=1081104 RepID=A0A162JSW1_CORFA|nr:Six-bladed beta-propeller, TolB-like protein [Cordyceps fumosorosea ARSEF 2679]OAA73292.1 Six-bladed beta-propeller, TolB-like protein [Cordyceps fumosorosea ARSEF 2679]
MLPLTRTALAVLALALTSQATYTTRLLYQFPDYLQWIENMAVRPNGNILLTTFDRAHVYELDPTSGRAPGLVAALPDADAAIGITEIAPDLFAVEAGLLNRTDYQLHGSGRIDTLDFSCPGCAALPRVRTRVAALPDAKLLNGMAALSRHVVLSADSITGTVYRTDTATGAVSVAFRDPRLAPRDNPDPFLRLLGVNGLRTHGDYLYVTSTSAGFLGRYPVDARGTPRGALEVLAGYAAPRSPDDFAVARNGTVFGAVPLDSVARVAPGGSIADYVAFIVNHDGRLQRPTSTVLSLDERTLYVSTGGRNKPGGKGGQIFAVSL